MRPSNDSATHRTPPRVHSLCTLLLLTAACGGSSPADRDDDTPSVVDAASTARMDAAAAVDTSAPRLDTAPTAADTATAVRLDATPTAKLDAAAPEDAAAPADTAEAVDTMPDLPPPPPPPPPAPYMVTPVGDLMMKGEAGYDGKTFTVKASGRLPGSDVDDGQVLQAPDAFELVHRAVSGDFEIAARVAGLDKTHDFARAGLMARDGTTTTAAHATMAVSPKFATFTYRRPGTKTTGYQWDTAAAVTPPAWLRLRRKGNVFTGETSKDGKLWTLQGTAEMALPAELRAGLATAAYDPAALTTATYESVKTNNLFASKETADWSHDELFVTGGSAIYKTGVFTIEGGHSMESAPGKDSLTLVSRPIAGSTSVVARVEVKEGPATALAGIAIRGSTTPTVMNARLTVGKDGTLQFGARPSSSMPYVTDDKWKVAGLTGLLWLRLERVGPKVTASYAKDGPEPRAWKVLGASCVSFRDDAVAALLVGSGQATALAKATFDNVKVEPLVGRPEELCAP